jgi:hypothetical protein
MKWVHDIFCALALALAMTTAAVADDKPGMVIANEVEATATVESVDQAKRTVTLKGPEGNVVTIKVPDEAQNLDQVAAGDKVRVRYLESTAIFVSGEAGDPAATQVDAVQLAPKGGTPGGIAATVTEVSAKVEALDYDQRWVKLRGPEGNVVKIDVPESVKRFREVKVGDLVVVRHTEAIGLMLQKQ